MKLRNLLFAGLLIVGNSYAATFTPKTTTNKKVVDYFHKLLPTTTINTIYITRPIFKLSAPRTNGYVVKHSFSWR